MKSFRLSLVLLFALALFSMPSHVSGMGAKSNPCAANPCAANPCAGR